MVVIDLNLASYLGKTYCVGKRKKKKMDMENLIIGASFERCLLNREGRYPCHGKAPDTRFYNCIKVKEDAQV